MSTARDYLAEHLAEELGAEWRIIPWDDNPTVTEPTVLFFRSAVEPTPEAPLGSWTHDMTLYVVGPRQEGQPALDAVDGLLDDVLTALHNIPGVLWSNAEYQTLRDTYPAFKVTAQVFTKPAPDPAPEPDPEP